MNASRYILYTRVSTAAQDDNNSHESQLAALQKHVAARGGLIVKVIRETASGGSYLGRPGIREAIETLERDEADVLLCFDFSRYSRDEEHQQAMMKRVERAGKRIEFSNLELARDDQGQLTPESRLMMSMNGGFAAYHKAKIRADTMRGARASAEKGIQPRRRSPFGYHVVTNSDVLAGRHAPELLGKYLIIEEQAVVVRELFERRAKGEGFISLCRWLAQIGVRTSRGTVWVSSMLVKILTNPVYKGEAAYGRTRRVNDETRLERGYIRDFHYKKRPPSEVVLIPVPPIVSAETWQIVNDMVPARGVLGDRRARYLLSNVLKCPVCGGAMSGKTAMRAARGLAGRTGRPKKGESAPPAPRTPRRFYVCCPSEAEKLLGKRCASRQHDAAQLDGLVLGVVARLLDEPALLVGAKAGGEMLPQIRARRELEHEIGVLSARERTLIEAQLRALEQGISTETYEALLRENNAAKKAARSQLESLEAASRRGAAPRGEKQVVALLEELQLLACQPERLLPLSIPLQRCHNLMLALFESITFEEPARGVIDNLKLILRS